MSCTLAQLWTIYPIAESMASSMGLFDLVNLARTSSEYRATLRGLDMPPSHDEEPRRTNKGVRRSLCINAGKTLHWSNLTGKSIYWCEENTPRSRYFHERPGWSSPKDILPCRICSKPVCKNCNSDSLLKPLGGRDNPPFCREDYLFDERLYGQHYQSLCAVCCPQERIEKARSRFSSKPYDKRKHISLCRCNWPHNSRIRACLECRAHMRSDRETGRLLSRADPVPNSCARIACDNALWGFKRPWGRRHHTICIMCDLPREAEIPLQQ